MTSSYATEDYGSCGRKSKKYDPRSKSSFDTKLQLRVLYVVASEICFFMKFFYHTIINL